MQKLAARRLPTAPPRRASPVRPMAAAFPSDWRFVLGTAAVAAVAARAVQFVKADADLRTLACRRPSPSTFAGRTVWITGATSGLGAALAAAFSAAGAHVVLSARTLKNLETLASSLPGPTTVLPLDVTGSDDDLKAAAAAAAACGTGGLSMLVHGAGASQAAPAAETAPSTLAALLDVNAAAPLRLTAAALPHLLDSGKAAVAAGGARSLIVAVASMAAVVPSPGQAGYSAGKAALTAYLRAIDYELRPAGVATLVACPGPLRAPAGAPPRMVWGPAGLVPAAAEEAASKSRVTLDRAAALIVAAAGASDRARPRVAWIARHPVLLIGYLTQYAPALADAILARVGAARARALGSGGSGYDAGALLRGRRS